MSDKGHIAQRDQRMLHAKSGNRCAKCNAILVSDGVCIGENAHIYGENEGAARYDPSQPIEFVNSEDNLIFLCCSCHKKVDTAVEKFPVECLFALKQAHEQRVLDALKTASVTYTYAELETLTTYLIREAGKVFVGSNYQLLHIPEKIAKNQLQDVQNYIDMGLISVSRIGDYMNRHPDPRFAEKLTSLFVERYLAFRAQGIEPVVIFHNLWEFACNSQMDYNYRSAGLAILVYFFEKCEVFEK